MNDFLIRFVFDRKNEIKNKVADTALLQIEVREKGAKAKKTYVSTDIKLSADQLLIKNKEIVLKNGTVVIKNHTQAKALEMKAKRTYDSVFSFVSSDQCPKITDVKNWNKDTSNFGLVLPFMEDLKRKQNIALGTLKNYNVLINKIAQFNKIKTFDDFTYNNIVAFDNHLKKEGNNNSTLHKRHTLLRWYISEAIKMDLFFGKNPYDLFRIPKVNEVDTTYLLNDELKKIQDFQPNMSYLEKVKDLFLFQCYTGLAYVDLMNFEASNIEEVGGRLVIKDSRQKTDVNFIIPILPDAKAILDKYNNELPKITNQRYNKYLKELATAVDIDKTITTHVARHTFATYLLNKNIPIETVSKVLGHTNIRQTQHYAKLLGLKIVSDFDVLFDD